MCKFLTACNDGCITAVSRPYRVLNASNHVCFASRKFYLQFSRNTPAEACVTSPIHCSCHSRCEYTSQLLSPYPSPVNAASELPSHYSCVVNLLSNTISSPCACTVESHFQSWPHYCACVAQLLSCIAPLMSTSGVCFSAK